MTEDQIASIDILSDAVKSIHNCLQCRICLDMISSPIKTRCGHSFCRTCIGTVLSKKNTKCPLCNTALQRRSVSKDKHTEKCINFFEKLVHAIREDVNIDILSHKKNPRNTREGYATPNSKRYNSSNATSTVEKRRNDEKISSFFKKKKILQEEEQEQQQKPACSSRQDISDKLDKTCTEYKMDNSMAKDDDRTDGRKERKSSSTDGLSGVYPLLSSPQQNIRTNEDAIFMKKKRIKNWLKDLPNSAEQFDNPTTFSPKYVNRTTGCLDDTATVVSNISSMSSIGNIKVEKESYGSEHSMAQGNMENVEREASRKSTNARATNNLTRGVGNNKRKATTTRSFLEREIRDDSIGHKLKYETIHARVREKRSLVEKSSRNSHGDSLTGNRSIDAMDSCKQQQQQQQQLRPSGNTTKETWNRVVKFGKEMRTKKRKLKSLDVSVQSTGGGGGSSKPSDELIGKKFVTAKERRRNSKSSSTNLQSLTSFHDNNKSENVTTIEDLIDRRDNNDDDDDDDTFFFPSFSIGHDIANERSNNDKYYEEKLSQNNTSFISLEKEGRVPIMSLRREQMDDIIGVTSNAYEEVTNDDRVIDGYQSDRENRDTITGKRLSLRKYDDSTKGSSTTIANILSNVERSHASSKVITPVKINLEERYEVSRKSQILLSPRSRKREEEEEEEEEKKKKEGRNMPRTSTTTRVNDNPRLNESTSKVSLTKKNNEVTSSSLAVVDPSRSSMQLVGCCNPTEFGNRSKKLYDENGDKRTRVVPFNKLGKVFKRSRKVKFYKFGFIRKESFVDTLSVSLLNNSLMNVITLQGSDDSSTLEIDKTLLMEETCNLVDDRGGSSSIDLIVEKRRDAVKNYPIGGSNEGGDKVNVVKCSAKISSLSQDSLGVLLVSLKEPPTSDNKTLNRDDNDDVEQRYVKFDVLGESSSSSRTTTTTTTTRKTNDRSNGANELGSSKILDKNGIRAKPVITSIVRMMSPEEDSQLKFLNLESMPIKLRICRDSSTITELRMKSESKDDDRPSSTFDRYKEETDVGKLIVRNATNKIKSEREEEEVEEKRSSNNGSNDNDTNYGKSIDDNSAKEIARFLDDGAADNKTIGMKNRRGPLADGWTTVVSRSPTATKSCDTVNDEKSRKNKYKRIATMVDSSSDGTDTYCVVSRKKRSKGVEGNKKKNDDDDDDDDDGPNLGSDDNVDDKNVTMNKSNESKGKYERRAKSTAVNSGTGSDNLNLTRKRKMDVMEGNTGDKKVEAFKKKRINSDDSDDDNYVNMIVNDWCNGLKTSQRSVGNDNFNRSNTNAKKLLSTSNKPMTMIPQSINFDSWNNFDTSVKTIPKREVEPERSNNDIIDKVRSIRMNEDEENASRDDHRTTEKIDPSNEVEIITDSLTKNFFAEENVIVDTKVVSSNKETKTSMIPLNTSYIETNDFFADSNDSKMEKNLKEDANDDDNDDDDDDDDDDTLIENFNGSNKENETATYVINNMKDYPTKSNDPTCKQKEENNRRTTLTSGKERYEGDDKGKGQIMIEQKDTPCDYDSLLDVTQDQLLLNALEEDLFGTANLTSLGKSSANIKTTTLSQGKRSESSYRTPLKSKINREEGTNLRNKNTEEISSDDEIVENTPQSDKKFMDVDRSANFKARKSLVMSQTTTTTPASRKNFQVAKTTTATTITMSTKITTTTTTTITTTTTTTTKTPSSSVVAKLKTPIDQNKIRPLYQSTPKTIRKAVNRDYEESNLPNDFKGSPLKSKKKNVVPSRTNNKRVLSFVWSSLSINQIESIKKLAFLTGANWTQNFHPNVTHVIVGTDEHNNAATKTLKFLQGIAYRKYVVGFKWVADCLKEGTLINEEPYEAVDCYTLEAGPRKSRLREADLFDGFTFLCIEPFQNITITQFQDLLKAMGATIVQSMDALALVKEKHRVILIENEVHADEVVANWYAETTAIPVSCDWVVECISQYKLVSCYTHLHEVVQEDVLKLGYPEQMIDPEEFNNTSDTSIDRL